MAPQAAAAMTPVPEGGKVDVAAVSVPEAPVTSSVAKEAEAEPVAPQAAAPPASAPPVAVAPLSNGALSLELPSVCSSDAFGAGSDRAVLLEKERLEIVEAKKAAAEAKAAKYTDLKAQESKKAQQETDAKPKAATEAQEVIVLTFFYFVVAKWLIIGFAIARFNNYAG
jgi:hypothetical protein